MLPNSLAYNYIYVANIILPYCRLVTLVCCVISFFFSILITAIEKKSIKYRYYIGRSIVDSVGL